MYCDLKLSSHFTVIKAYNPSYISDVQSVGLKRVGTQMEEQRIAKAHKLVVNNRKTSMVTGVLDVLSFDLNEILLETEQGMLMVKGTDLHVNRLSVEKGEVDLSGNIDSIAYSSSTPAEKAGENFLSRLFR